MATYYEAQAIVLTREAVIACAEMMRAAQDWDGVQYSMDMIHATAREELAKALVEHLASFPGARLDVFYTESDPLMTNSPSAKRIMADGSPGVCLKVYRVEVNPCASKAPGVR